VTRTNGLSDMHPQVRAWSLSRRFGQILSAGATRAFAAERARPMPRRLALIFLAAVGATLLVVVARGNWGTFGDEHAYWLAGQRLLNGESLYDPSATGATPFAYWYPPLFAQLLAPLTAVIPAALFSAVWVTLLLVCLWWLSGREPFTMLALVAFVPVAVELMYRNVHLLLAVLIVLAIRRWPVLFAVGAAIKISPGVGFVYLLARRRVREAALTAVAGALMLAVSLALDPSLWQQFAGVLLSRGAADESAILPVPYFVRAAAGLALAYAAGRMTTRVGQPLLVVAIVLALPTLWVDALSTLVAVVPLLAWRSRHSSVDVARPLMGTAT
jgi:hypothetical protein